MPDMNGMLTRAERSELQRALLAAAQVAERRGEMFSAAQVGDAEWAEPFVTDCVAHLRGPTALRDLPPGIDYRRFPDHQIAVDPDEFHPHLLLLIGCPCMAGVTVGYLALAEQVRPGGQLVVGHVSPAVQGVECRTELVNRWHYDHEDSRCGARKTLRLLGLVDPPDRLREWRLQALTNDNTGMLRGIAVLERRA